MDDSLAELLYRHGVQFKWANGRLMTKGGKLTPEELALIREHRETVLGWHLLHELWAAGYELRIERSQFGGGHVLIPYGTAHEGSDFESLYALYETAHDSALKLLLDVCRRLKIEPTRWHEQAPRQWERLTADAEPARP